MVVGEKVYDLWQKPVYFQWRKCICFSLPFTSCYTWRRVCI